MTRFAMYGGSFAVNESVFGTNLGYVDLDFFKLFTYEFAYGSPKSLRGKNTILVSEEFAKKSFGQIDVLGKTIEHVQLNGQHEVYEIVGVFHAPSPNSSFHFDVCTEFPNLYKEVPGYNDGTEWESYTSLFLMLNEPTQQFPINQLLVQYVELNNNARKNFQIKRFELQQFDGMALFDQAHGILPIFTTKAPPLGIFEGSLIISLLAFCITCFNLTSSSIISFANGEKSICIRKILGGEPAHLIMVFLKDFIVVLVFAFVGGLVIANIILIPIFNALWPQSLLELAMSVQLAFALVAVAFIATLIFALYPFIKIIRLDSLQGVFGQRRKPGVSLALGHILLTLQVGISVVGVVLSIILIMNAQFQEKFDLGFDSKNGIYAWVNTPQEYDVYSNFILQSPFAHRVTYSKDHLFISSYKRIVRFGDLEIQVRFMDVGENYLSTVGFNLIEGRDFIQHSETDKVESTIVSANLARAIGLDEPIGRELIVDTTKLKIVGVIQNVYNNALWKDSEPLCIRYASIGDNPFVIARASDGHVADLNKLMEEKWKELFPDRIYPGRYLNAEINKAALINSSMAKMFVFLGFTVVLLSLVALNNLLSVHMMIATKQIAVRTVLGASFFNLILFIGRPYFLIVTLGASAGIIGCLIIVPDFMSSLWFFYQPLTGEILSYGTLLVIAMCLATMFLNLRKTISTSPVNVLRT